MKNDESVETTGTCLQGYVDAGYAELVELFGSPGEGDGYKVDAHWALRFPEAVTATVYNYKDGPNYNGGGGTPVAEIREWHVGGFDPVARQLVQAALDAHRAAWNVGEARLFERFKVRDAEGEHVGDSFKELATDFAAVTFSS